MYRQAKEAMISRTRAHPNDDAARLTGEDLLAAVHDADPQLARLLDPVLWLMQVIIRCIFSRH